MAKLPPPFLLLLLLGLAVAGLASAARTAITTTVVEVDGRSTASDEQCRQKMSPCLKYLTTRSRGPTNLMAEKLLRMCCVQLKSMDEHCMRGSLETMAMNMMQKDEGTGQETEKMLLQEPRGSRHGNMNKLAGTGFGPKRNGWAGGYDGFGPKRNGGFGGDWGIDGFGPEWTDLDKPT